jgi:hypothetical protein
MYYEKIKLIKLCFIYLLFVTVFTLIVGCLNGKWLNVGHYFETYQFEMFSNLFIKIFSFSVLFISIILLFIVLLRKGWQLKQKELVVLLLAVVTFLFWILQGVFSDNTSVYELIAQTGCSPVSILIPITILLGFYDEIWNVLKKYAFPLATLLLAIGIYTGLQFRIQYGFTAVMEVSNVKILFIYGFWIGAFYCYAVADSKVKQYVICILAVLCAIFTVSRGWFIQSFALTVLSLSLGKSQSKRLKFLKILVFVLLLLTILSYTFSNSFLLLINRLGEDSRSGQYTEFFQQVSLGEILTGKGYGAGYTYFGRSNYKYFDNQFICIMFHYGILPVLCFLYILTCPIAANRKMRKQQKIMMWPYIFFFLHWLLAMAGLSVYFTFDLNLCSMILGVYGGHCLKEVRQRRMQPLQIQNEMSF